MRRISASRRWAWVAVCSLAVWLCSCQKEASGPMGKPAPAKGGATPAAAQAAAPAKPAMAPKIIKTKSNVEMVVIPEVSFTMGDKNGGPDVQAVHKVTLSSYCIDRYEVSQAQYEEMIGNNPSNFEGEKNPVDRVRWTQAARYCNARSENDGLKLCYDEETWKCDFEANGYRLPTEAEWECACRAGTETTYSFGNDAQGLGAYAWFKPNSDKKTHEVGTKQPNAWGIFDMHGNLYEWCNDWYAPDYYKSSPEKDPRGPDKGEKRALRGGSWSCPPEKCTAAFRLSDAPTLPDVCLGYDDYGFRCVRKPLPEEVK